VVEVERVPRGYEHYERPAQHGAVQHDLKVVPEAQQARAPPGPGHRAQASAPRLSPPLHSGTPRASQWRLLHTSGPLARAIVCSAVRSLALTLLGLCSWGLFVGRFAQRRRPSSNSMSMRSAALLALAALPAAAAFAGPAIPGASIRLRGGASPLMMAQKPVLYDMPVSNNGARCRIVIYKKGIEDQIDIKSPMDIGGLR
jgi:hypothetical protein